MKLFSHYLLFLSLISFAVRGQVLPPNRSVNWGIAGYKGNIPDYSIVVDINNFGGDNTGTYSNNAAFTNAVNSLLGANGVIYFPKGTYLFNTSINLRSGLILRGVESDSSILKFNLGGGNSGDAIEISGAITSLNTSLSSNAFKDSMFVYVDSVVNFSQGDYIKLSINDSALLTSTWANGSVGQILKIKNIYGNKIVFESPLRLNYNIAKQTILTKVIMKTGIGIECLKINRVDTSANQTSNIDFTYAAQC